jgi:putative acetyltransferase
MLSPSFSFRRLSGPHNESFRGRQNLTDTAPGKKFTREPRRAVAVLHLSENQLPDADNPMIIRPETPADVAAIYEVNRLAFGQEAEARLVSALRDGGFARVSLVAEIDGQIVGHVMFSDLSIVTPDRTIAALALAPMAVLPNLQGKGIGSQLVRQGLAVCQAHGHQIVIVLGHPHYYQRFGFSTELAKPLASPFSGDAWMALELLPGSLKGVVGRVAYSPPLEALE